MIKKTPTVKESFDLHRFCDVCGKEIIFDVACSRAVCECCQKDLCNACVGHEDRNPSDYRTVWCLKCWEIGSKYRPQIKALESQIEALYSEWQNLCKETAND